jgi:glycosyltransferase involved in cell wall biosynthesis
MLLICDRFPPDLGGVARSAARTAGALAALGSEVRVLAWTRALPAGCHETRLAAARSASTERVLVTRVGLFANLDSTLQHGLGLLEAWHRDTPFQAVWGHYLVPAGFLAVLFGELAGIPATASARGNDLDMLMFPPGDFARLAWTLSRAHIVTAVSADLARKARAIASLQRNVVVVPNSVDTALFRSGPAEDALRESLGIAPDEAVLAFSGELRQKKGIGPLLEAFAQVRAARPACLLVIGEVRLRDQPVLMSFAASHPEASRRVLVTGHEEEPAEVARRLRLADVFVQPSLWEGLPNALLEAMACERVVIGSDAGGIPEAIEHGVSGFCVARGDLHRLGEALLETLALPLDQRRAIGAAARRRVLAAFHAEHESAALRVVLEKLGLPPRD